MFLHSVCIEQHDQFTYPFRRLNNPTTLRDIHDGAVFQQLMTGGGLFSTPESTGLLLCSDGVPVFKSSKGSLWPVYLMVTSIPPHQRTRVDNLIVAALWHGPTKPDMEIVLQPILENISSLNRDGIYVQNSKSQPVLLRPKLVMAVFDQPGRATATNTKQFNGEYGCFYCLDKGEVHNRARIYPPDASHTLRTQEQMKAWASVAQTTGKPQYGVKGVSVLAEAIEFPQCIPIDYMHCILEGVFKQLMKFWFDPKFHSEPYSLRKYIAPINRLVSKIKPPNEVLRLPRPIEQISFFKASEYRSWVLFYALPVLSSFLPPEYTHHLSLLVSSLHILLSDEINVVELDTTHQMLSTFYQAAGDLYSLNAYTSNMHLLEHIVPLVRLWGPLWAYSMFSFENLNGYLGSTFHGTNKIVLQMSFQIQLLQTLPVKLRELSETESPATQAYLERVLTKKRANMHKIDDECYTVGKVASHNLTTEEQNAIFSSGITLLGGSKVQRFERLMLKNVIYCSESYSRSSSRNNTACCYHSANGLTGYGRTQAFYISEQIPPFCLIKTFQVTGNSPLTNLRPARNKQIRRLNVNRILCNQVINVTKDSSKLVAMPLKHIMKKCLTVSIPIEGRYAEYIIPIPNTYEFH